MHRPLLLIGVHRSELAFGDGVARNLADVVDVLRVDQGLSGARPTPDDLFHYRIRHREMYSQVLQRVGRRKGAVIDLHTGVNEGARCADVYCHDATFRACLRQALSGRDAPPDVRVLAIMGEQEADQPDSDRGEPVVRTCIPPDVWRSRRFLYVGVEVFLPVPGAGYAADLDFAGALVRLVAQCAGVT